MGCRYTDEQLQEWDGVANPMGEACRNCRECTCSHWDGDCPCDLEGTEDCMDPERPIEVSIWIGEIYGNVQKTESSESKLENRLKKAVQ